MCNTKFNKMGVLLMSLIITLWWVWRLGVTVWWMATSKTREMEANRNHLALRVVDPIQYHFPVAEVFCRSLSNENQGHFEAVSYGRRAQIGKPWETFKFTAWLFWHKRCYCITALVHIHRITRDEYCTHTPSTIDLIQTIDTFIQQHLVIMAFAK